jgi:hypothetical protein
VLAFSRGQAGEAGQPVAADGTNALIVQETERPAPGM